METANQIDAPTQAQAPQSIGYPINTGNSVALPPQTVAKPKNKLLYLWIVLGIIGASLTAAWIWGRINFVVVNKPYSQGNVLHIRYLKLSHDGFLMVNRSEGGLPGLYIGASHWAPKGFYTNIWINLHEMGDETKPPHELQPNERVFLKMFHDTNNDGIPETEIDTLIKEYVIDL